MNFHIDPDYENFKIMKTVSLKSLNLTKEEILNAFVDFFKNIKSLEPKKVIMIGEYKGWIYKDYVKVGCQIVSKKQIEEILEIMNK